MKKETKAQFKKRMLKQIKNDLECLRIDLENCMNRDKSYQAGTTDAYEFFYKWVKADLGDV